MLQYKINKKKLNPGLVITGEVQSGYGKGLFLQAKGSDWAQQKPSNPQLKLISLFLVCSLKFFVSVPCARLSWPFVSF